MALTRKEGCITTIENQVPSVRLELTSDEALVLFALLSRELEKSSGTVTDGAERKVLSGLLCDLEQTLAAPLALDYKQQLAAARERLALQFSGIEPDELSSENDG